MKFEHTNIHTTKKLNEAHIVLSETSIKGIYLKVMDYTTDLDEKYYTTETVCRLLNDHYGVAVWNNDNTVEFNF